MGYHGGSSHHSHSHHHSHHHHYSSSSSSSSGDYIDCRTPNTAAVIVIAILYALSVSLILGATSVAYTQPFVCMYLCIFGSAVYVVCFFHYLPYCDYCVKSNDDFRVWALPCCYKRPPPPVVEQTGVTADAYTVPTQQPGV